ncbi:Aquaporin AQPcic [Frankliniella fusca]|uniref:Aquaporin AQPcic n=1 Tax=Frankliniella fusca TaxID=407009 RepID=A0AAE1LQN0_9NEOP|nr:Aquaporin AQPcic [Frankliniella fusca]
MPADVSKVLGHKELKQQNLYRALAAECLGTLLLNFYGVISCVKTNSLKNDLVEVSLTFGLVVFAVVQVFGHVSGAHVNPAVTVGMLATGRTPVVRGLLYIIAQCVGAIIGTGLVKAVTPESFTEVLGNTKLTAKGITTAQGFGVEFLLGFILVLVVFAVCDPNRPECKYAAPLAIGLTVALGHLATIDYTGSSMNPARSLGSAVLTSDFEHHWVYWLGPCAGGMAAGLLYTFVFAAPAPTHSQTTYTVVSTSDKEVKLHMKRLDDEP